MRTRALRRIMGTLVLVIVAAESVLAFLGPWAVVAKPSLLVMPSNAPGFSEEKRREAHAAVERALAARRTYTIYPVSFIENWFLETKNQVDIFDGTYIVPREAREAAAELDLERVILVTFDSWNASFNVTMSLHDVPMDRRIESVRVTHDSFDDFIQKAADEEQPPEWVLEMTAPVAGMSLADKFFLLWLGVQAVLGVWIIRGRGSITMFAVMLAAGGMLHLFASLYALNGDMDYVQRFVATSGSLDLADTATERGNAALRFLPLQLLNLGLWAVAVFRRLRGKSIREDPRSLFREPALLWVLLSSFLYALALPNFLKLEGLPLLAWIAPVPLLLVLRFSKPLKGFLYGLIFVGFQAMLINYWQGTFSYVSLPFTSLLTLVKYLPFILLLALTVRHGGRFWWIMTPALWTAFDWLRSLGFLGYPWGILGVSQYASVPLIQTASLTGVWGVSFLVHLFAAALGRGLETVFFAESTLERDLEPSPPRRFDLFRPWIPTVAAAVLVLIALLGGAITVAVRERRDAGAERVTIALIQQNTDPRKHDYRLSLKELIRLSDQALASGPVDLVVWPESGFSPDVRFWLRPENLHRSRRKLVDELFAWHSERKTALVTGTQDHFYEFVDGEKMKRIHNSSMYLKPDLAAPGGRTYYYKIRLVPFTENFPYGERFPWIAELLHNFNTTQWTPGTQWTVYDGPGFTFSTPICFEDVFPGHVRRFVLNGAQVIVNISNDYWANTPLEGYQHGAHASFRAVENRRPLVRATSSGWTLAVSAEGRLDRRGPPFYEPGYLAADVALPDSGATPSLYLRWGDWFPKIMGLLCIIMGAVHIVHMLIYRRTGSSESIAHVPPLRDRASSGR